MRLTAMRVTAAAALLALLAGAPAALAAPGDAGPAEAADTSRIAFEADRVDYAEDPEKVVASGNVVLRRADDRSVRADTITWNRKTGAIVAQGNVRMVDENGNLLFTDQVELTDEFETGAMQNLLMVLREGGRVAANSGERNAKGEVTLTRAAYTACQVEDAKGCPKTPTWRVIAGQVLYDPARKLVRFRNARLEFFGAMQLPLPGLQIATDGRAVSGLLIPDFRVSPANGMEVSQSYMLKLGDNRDITGTVIAYTKVAPMFSAQYRELNSKGAFQITGYVTNSRRIPVSGTVTGPTRDTRGYLFANGRYQLSPEWSITASLRRASDRTFLRRYFISRDDRLRSTIDVERIDANSYFSLAGWSTQTMRSGDRQGLVPTALPVLDYRRRLTDPVLGGRVELQVNSLAIARTSGQDTQRAFASARWDLSRYTGLGQEIRLTGLVRGDVYHSDENALTTTAIYRGNPGWETRGIATAAVDVRWPLIGGFLGGTQILTPRVQLVATPSVRNLSIPNEDARAIDLEDSNLFALNRFPGYDRIEDGVRFTYGFDWQITRPSWRIKTTIGQSVRLTDKPTLLPDGTGLTSRTSDIVGRTEIRFRDIVRLVHRFRLDKDSLSVRRNEFDATVGSQRTYFEVGYVKLNRNIAATLEDLRDREELRAAARIGFARYWSVFGSAVVNLTDRNDDPVFGSDGFQPLRARIGAAYQDDCMEFAVTWRRDYVANGDARRGNSFQLRFALRNIGLR